MKKTFNKSYIQANRSCRSQEYVDNLYPAGKNRVHIKDIINSELPLKDAYWFLFKKCDLTLKQKLSHCLELAWIVLPVYEKKYPKDKRVRKCLQAVKKFNENKITIGQLKNAAAAATDAATDAASAADVSAADAAAEAVASAAAYAAASAYAYAYASAADVVASAIAYTAYVADYAAYAAYAADVADVAGDKTRQKLIQCTINFINKS